MHQRPSNSIAGASGANAQHLGDPSTERMLHQRILGGRGRRSAVELGLPEGVAEPGVDQALVQGGAVRLVQRLPDGPHGALRGRRRLGRDRRRDLVGARPQLVAVDDLGHQADAQRRVGADPFVVAGQRHSQGLAQPDPAHQADRLERRHHAGGDVRVEERGVGRADHDVGFVDEVERAGGAHALHRAHHGLPHLLPLGAEQLAGILVVPHVVGLAVGLLGVEARRRTHGRPRPAAPRR